MIILITGGTGLVGSALVRQLEDAGHEVRILSRNYSQNAKSFQWDVHKQTIDEAAFIDIDGIIHLAGASIGARWTAAYKEELYTSRIGATEFLLKTCEKLQKKLKFFISASGINFYGTFTSSRILTENDGILKQDFLAKLSADWEAAAYHFSDVAERVICVRTAMVLADRGGSYPLLKKIVDFNLGAPVGSGKQWMNWIHLTDLLSLYQYFVENVAPSGGYNAVADEAVTNRNFMKQLAAKEKKFFLPVAVPSVFLKVAFGEMASIILEGTRASNKKVKEIGFKFQHETLQSAFKALKS